MAKENAVDTAVTRIGLEYIVVVHDTDGFVMLRKEGKIYVPSNTAYPLAEILYQLRAQHLIESMHRWTDVGEINVRFQRCTNETR